ncbi:MAG TPA: VWA domain-containing protein [Methanoregulaceae archaeon]|nr:VWA domain-containing protein [Methanoregulaceae archaeon]
MVIRKGLILLLFLSLLAGVVSAASGPPAFTASITSSKSDGWFVANGTDSGTITVSVKNMTIPVNGSQVTFSINNTLLGTISPQTAITSNGIASTVFSTFKKSGDITINATVRYRYNESDTNEPYKYLDVSLFQQIDHDTPYRISSYYYANEMTVATVNPITLGFVDQWGNPVDSRRKPEQVSLTVSTPAPQDGGFSSGSSWVNNTVMSTDRTGNVSVNLKVNHLPGWNVVFVHPLMTTADGQQAIVDKYLWIEGLPGVPWSIDPVIDPSSKETYADGISQFHVTYILKDKFGNLVMNRSVRVDTSIAGESTIVGTNAQGEAMLMYGPKSSIGMVWLNATPLDNTSIQSQQQVWFISQQPTDMLLTATPQTMPSIDASPGFTADVMAKVTDILGNPVANQTVTFAINNIHYDNANSSAASVSNPSISSTSAVTDEDGYATIDFTPGGFITNYSDNHYNATATGMCNVTATWNSTSHSIPLVWKNYPYLSLNVQTSASTVNVNDTVLVDVQLKGDGWALQPKPIDVYLVVDRSGSMLYDTPDREYSVRLAAQGFVNNMSAIRDRVGIVSYGWKGTVSQPGYNSGTTAYRDNTYPGAPATYSDYATIDQTLNNNFTAVNNAITRIVPDGGTPTRQALYNVITNLKSSGRSNAVKAIIILSDGDYNWYGDPLAVNSGRGHTTWSATDFGDLDSDWYQYSGLNAADQNMSRYAKDNGIVIYSIGFANSISNGGKTSLTNLAQGTGGQYYSASATNIGSVYTTIAGALQTVAGVNTNLNLRYDQIELNYVTEPNSGNTTSLQYVYSPGTSTYINSYWMNGTTLASYPQTIDQTGTWNGNPKQLIMNAGTISLNQVWEAKYLLQVVATGNINIFGPNSVISFNNGTQTLSLPKTYISSIPNMTNTSVTTNELKYTSITQETGSPGDPESQMFITFYINSVYTGTKPLTERYYIITYDQHKYLVGTRILQPAEASQPRTFRMRISDLPTGWIQFLPVVDVEDAPGPERPVVPPNIAPPPTSPGKVYIQLS